MKDKVRKFTQLYIHYIVSRSDEVILHHLSTSLHDDVPNEVVLMDFLTQN